MRFHTDKLDHGYMPVYYQMASEIGLAGHVCEVGTWKGDSLDAWQALFPQGLVVGIDRDPSACWPEGTIKVVSDQGSPDLPARLRQISPDDFHLVIDDASHAGALSTQTFNLLWPLVRPGGWYVVEDWMIGFDSWPNYDDSMLRLAESFLRNLEFPDGEVASIEYRYGLITLRKKSG